MESCSYGPWPFRLGGISLLENLVFCQGLSVEERMAPIFVFASRINIMIIQIRKVYDTRKQAPEKNAPMCYYSQILLIHFSLGTSVLSD